MTHPFNSETREFPMTLSRRLRIRRLEGEWQVAIRRCPTEEEIAGRSHRRAKGWSKQEQMRDAARWGWFVGQHSDLLTAVSRAAGVSSFDPDVRQLTAYLEGFEYAPKAPDTAVA